MTGARLLRISSIVGAVLVFATSTPAAPPRHIKLAEAVRLALEQNRTLKIAHYKVQENEQQKAGARSAYYPILTNESNVLHITELQNLQIPQGAFGNVAGSLVPAQSTTLPQGKDTFISSGTMLAQPITQLLRIHQQNRIAENEVALQVHALYFGILVAQLQKKAAEQETSFATETLRENENDVRNGSALKVAQIQSQAQLLQGQQSVLTAELQIEDYTVELNDLLGLPLDTKLELDPEVDTNFETLTKADYVEAAWKENPQIRSAEESVAKARAGVAAAKTAYIPDITAFARYSYQDGVPFFVHNFGTVGINMNYTLWDFGKRKATVRERDAQLGEAEQNLEHLKEEVAVDVERTYNKLVRTKSMVSVATQVAELRQESERLATDQAAQGVVLISDVRNAAAANYKAKADLLQATLGYVLARAELERTVGRSPGLATP
jgi:outer membrane protein TolC